MLVASSKYTCLPPAPLKIGTHVKIVDPASRQIGTGAIVKMNVYPSPGGDGTHLLRIDPYPSTYPKHFAWTVVDDDTALPLVKGDLGWYVNERDILETLA